jgi:RNA polymerase sigma-70 factor (ECF subfamily)
MRSEGQPDTEELIRLAQGGDASARGSLLVRHQDRLRRMIEIRMDPRLRPRIDPSDVVQEALMEASQRLTQYLERRPLPFYPWIRQIARDRLIGLHRQHLLAQKRSVKREVRDLLALSDHSTLELANRLMDGGLSPSGRMLQDELRARVKAALERLGQPYREVLVLLYLEEIPYAEGAAVLGISEAAVKMRHLRALRQLASLLRNPWEESG